MRFSLSRCWLNPIPFYASFLAPVALIIIINFIVFIMVLRQLMGAATKNIDKSDRSKTSSRLRGAVTLVIMLGLTWVFAILAIDGGAPVFQYLFTIFNSLQGLFIFVFHCLLKTDAQKAWKRTCCAGDKDLDSKTSKGAASCYSTHNDTMYRQTDGPTDISIHNIFKSILITSVCNAASWSTNAVDVFFSFSI